MKNYGSANYGDNYSLDGFDSVLGKAESFMPRCFTSHPALEIEGFKVYGGSCSAPVVKDADIYIGLDHSMKNSKESFPWNNTVIEIFYPITDMSAPKDAKEFLKMIKWTAEQIRAGKKVHIGCIGGHGRTGTVLAALVAYMTGEKDAITYVRKHYCEKAVESDSQIAFLNKNFGITKVEGTKAHFEFSGKSKHSHSGTGYLGSQASNFKDRNPKDIFPVASEKSIWETAKTK